MEDKIWTSPTTGQTFYTDVMLPTDLQEAVSTLIYREAGRVSNLTDESRSRRAEGFKLADDEMRQLYLAQIELATQLLDQLGRTQESLARWALHYGATYSEVGAAAGMTKQAAHQRFRIPDDWEGREFLPQPSRSPG